MANFFPYPNRTTYDFSTNKRRARGRDFECWPLDTWILHTWILRSFFAHCIYIFIQHLLYRTLLIYYKKTYKFYKIKGNFKSNFLIASTHHCTMAGKWKNFCIYFLIASCYPLEKMCNALYFLLLACFVIEISQK